LEEERRLAYVGLTRARKRAIVSFAANRQIYGSWTNAIPSRFVDELPEAQLERSGSAALARQAQMAAPSVFSNGPLMARRPRAAEPWEQAARPARAEKINVGQRVFHQKFGYGQVIASDDDKLDIDFEKAGQKRVMDRFVEKA
jgi:DNA helicase-2/ATP-dependent DNA helicase PcrA